MTSEADRRLLLQMARAAILARLQGAPALPVAEPVGPVGHGVFVTVRTRKELRGCVGHVGGPAPLVPLVARCAVNACTSDPRFAPIEASELVDLSIELSVLGPLEAIQGPQEIEVGVHGLLVERGRRRGLLLPQVAVEYRWDRQQFLEHACRKAGLPHDAWRDGAALWRFEADVFGEPDRLS